MPEMYKRNYFIFVIFIVTVCNFELAAKDLNGEEAENVEIIKDEEDLMKKNSVKEEDEKVGTQNNPSSSGVPSNNPDPTVVEPSGNMKEGNEKKEFVDKPKRHCYLNKNDDDNCDNTKKKSCSSVVLYQPQLTNDPLRIFKIPTRIFQFAGRQLTIQQKWNDFGVAAVVWESAIVLCEFLEQQKHLVQKRNVLELGSGTGLVGLVAAFLGGNVTVTERESVLDYLDSTVKANVADVQNNRLHPVQIRALKLDWRDDLADSFPPQYDLILGADIVYIKETFPDLRRTLLHLSNRPNCSVLLSCKIRYEKDSNFLEMMRKDFVIKRLVYDTARNISIYKMKRKHFN